MAEQNTQRTSRMYAEAKLGIAPQREEVRREGVLRGMTQEEQQGEPVSGGGLRLIVDRRTIPRRQVEMGAMAVFVTGVGAGLISRVKLRDMSWTGVGCVGPVAVALGSTVRLTPEHAMVPMQVGTVVRCEPRDEGDGFDIGVRLTRGASAA
jgi:hypothetical protein